MITALLDGLRLKEPPERAAALLHKVIPYAKSDNKYVRWSAVHAIGQITSNYFLQYIHVHSLHKSHHNTNNTNNNEDKMRIQKFSNDIDDSLWTSCMQSLYEALDDDFNRVCHTSLLFLKKLQVVKHPALNDNSMKSQFKDRIQQLNRENESNCRTT